jgi:hypothetical protein
LTSASRKARRLVRTRLLPARFTSERVSVCRARFSDDTWFAIILPYLSVECGQDEKLPHP